MSARAVLVIPALNEEATIGGVVREAREHFAGPIVVADNGSDDGTAAAARAAGARVASEPVRGYGRACLAGARAAGEADVLVFMDGDGSDRPADIAALLGAIEAGADLAIGVRRGPDVEPGSMTGAARFGNWLCGVLLGARYGRRLHDLSPLKAVRQPFFDGLRHDELTYGWTVELLARSLAAGGRVAEVEVGYRRRAGGVSKVSGDLRASMRAGARILATLWRMAVWERRQRWAGPGLGLMAAVAVLLVVGWWLMADDSSGPRALVAVWLLAWPTLLVGAVGGWAVGALWHRG
ncbi:MAG: glycosyltransferase family 2 protein [Dehalococcoidia bacterium]